MIDRALKLTREFHRLSQSEVAERLGISKSYISELESGAKIPTIDLLQRYSAEFGIPVSTLLMIAERMQGKEDSKQGPKVERVMQFLEWVLDDQKEKRVKHGARSRKTA